MYNLRNETINIEIFFTNYSSTTDVTLPLVALRMPTRGKGTVLVDLTKNVSLLKTMQSSAISSVAIHSNCTSLMINGYESLFSISQHVCVDQKSIIINHTNLLVHERM